MRTLDDLWAVIILDDEGNEEGLGVYVDKRLGPVPLVGTDWVIIAAMLVLFKKQNPEQAYRVKRFEAGAEVDLTVERKSLPV